MATLRCLISIAVVNSWPLYKLDVNNALKYGDLVEDVYMTLPQGYDNVDKSKVCKLTKSLYGLKQAPRQWNAKLTTALDEHGFDHSKFDYSLYIKQKGNVFVTLLVYVDDIYFLGIEILENDNGLCMCQRKYCLELLHEYGLLAARPVDISLPENSNLLHSLGLKGLYPVDLNYDNSSAIQIAANHVFHERTKLIGMFSEVMVGINKGRIQSKKEVTISSD
ncbi:ribonuclease H-like domain-containing protein [Tanacetum coccineum]